MYTVEIAPLFFFNGIDQYLGFRIFVVNECLFVGARISGLLQWEIASIFLFLL